MSPVEALQAALAAEYEAVFGYGVLGPQLDAQQAALAQQASDAHEALRNQLQALVVARRQQPAAPQADYPDLYPVRDAAAARTLAVRLEERAAAAWRAAFAAAAGANPVDTAMRDAAQPALTASAVRAMQWRRAIGSGPPTVPFPGLSR